MPSASSSSAIITEPAQTAVVPTVSSLKQDQEILEAPTVTQLVGETPDQTIHIDPVEDTTSKPEIHILVPEKKSDEPKDEVIVETGPEMKAEPVREVETAQSDSAPLVEDQILFNAGVTPVQLDYEKMMQVILICANVFLLGVILFLSLR